MTFLKLIFFSSMLLVNCGVNGNYVIEPYSFQNMESAEKQEAEKLRNSFRKLTSSPYNAANQQEYFSAFPNTFIVFNRLFGYSDKAPLGDPNADFDSPFYDQAYEYVNAFLNLKSIDKREYYNRIIDISIEGRWYADGVSYFQNGVHKKVTLDIDLFLELLSKRSDKEIKSFWYFYFDGPHPIKELPEDLKKIKQIDNKMYSLMELALIEVRQAWKD